ncbi:Alpha/Beta hydrolase protein [Aspergillus karnatakaensis]|uniref:alpha/beta hydrolase n=1 Tax=Aspergillus karnatakaensis TaxID=1810916 RepID=UPI003CCC93E6
MSFPRPSLNPDLAEVHKTALSLDVDTPEKLHSYREAIAPFFTLENTIRGNEDAVSAEEFDIPGPACPLRTTVFRPKNRTRTVEDTPGILHVHGGGLTTGNRFLGLTMLDWVTELGAVILTADYRLAPEHPQPAALEDTYAALQFLASHAAEFGFNPDKIIVVGGSAGGNLAAGVALLARDRSGPRLAGQVLMYPWLDDRTDSLSVQQYADIPPVKKSELITVSHYAFGRNGEYADIYTAPSRATNLTGLPPTLIDVGEADVFRDQDVAYASALWRDGVSTELHVYPGSWHGFDVFVPDAPISRRAIATRLEWLKVLLSR